MSFLILVSWFAACQFLTDEEISQLLVDRLELQPSTATVSVGRSVQFHAEPQSADGTPVSGQSVSWSSLDPSVATMNSQGMATAVSIGTAHIIASTSGSEQTITATASVSVVQEPVASVTVTPASATLSEGSGLQLAVTVADAAGNTLTDRPVTWSSSDTTIVRVSQIGYVTGRSPGSTTVSAASEGVSNTASISVAAPPQPPPPSGDVIPAFPEAVGHGAMALNACRSKPLAVHKVTNTNDNGSGSLRAAIAATSPDRFDVIIFRTGGTITLAQNIDSDLGCVYVAGQTAPGGGIQLTNRRWRVNFGSNLVIRYLKHRHKSRTSGWTWVVSEGGRHIYFDHVSAQWGSGDATGHTLNVGPTGGGNVTVAYTLTAEPDAAHPTVLQMIGAPKTNPQFDSVSVWRDFLGGPGHRVPMFNGEQVTMANTVVYNWKARGSEAQNEYEIQYLNNYHKRGPATPSDSRPFVMGDGCGGDPENPLADGSCRRRVFVFGNRSAENSWAMDTPVSQVWRGSGRQLECRAGGTDKLPDVDGFQCNSNGDTVPLAWRLGAPFATTGRIPLPILPMTDVLVEEIVSEVGASRRLDCTGAWMYNRDAVDARILNDFRNGTGPTEINVDALTHVSLAAGTPCTDTDSDGLPDQWEQRFFSCATCANPAAPTASGYLTIEHYLNGSDPR